MESVLPKLAVPSFTVTVPSTNKKVKMRPFLVKEEKILLAAKESKNPEDVVLAMKDIIFACSFEVLDVEKLATFDIEFLFIKLRGASVGEVVEINFSCPECKKKIEIEIDLEKVKIKKDKKHSKNIAISEDVIITMNYPTLESVMEDSEDPEKMFALVVSMVDSVMIGDVIYNSSDLSKEEIGEFLDSMTSGQFSKVKEFFDTMPRMSYNINEKCSHCGFIVKHEFKGLSDFFA